jgi:hypothetical protein
LPSSSQKEDSYVKKEEGNSKEEKKESMEIQEFSDVTEQTEGDTNISPYLHQDDQSFAKPVKDGERLGGGIDNLSEQNKASLEDNEHNIEELGSEHLLTNSKTGEHIEERKDQLIGKSHNQATPGSELIKETHYLMKSIKQDMQDDPDNKMKARDGQTDDKLNKNIQMSDIAPEEIADSDAVDLETQYHDENRSKTKEGQEDNKLNIKIPLPNITREEMKDSNTNQEIEEPLKSIGSESTDNDSTEMNKERTGCGILFHFRCRRSKNKTKGERKKVKQKSKGIEDSRLEKSTDSAANRKVAKKGTTQQKKSIGNIEQKIMSIETSL